MKASSADCRVPNAESCAWVRASWRAMRDSAGARSAVTSCCTRPARSRPEPMPRDVMLAMSSRFLVFASAGPYKFRASPSRSQAIVEQPQVEAPVGRDRTHELLARNAPDQLARVAIQHVNHRSLAVRRDLETELAVQA